MPSAPPPTPADRSRRTAGLAVMVVGLCATVWPGSPQWVVLAGFSVAAAFGLPLLVAGSPGTARRIVPVAVGAVAVLAALAGWARATGDLPARDRDHDGGVIVTRAAADEIRHGRNPYTADFGPLLPESWQLVQGTDGEVVANPVRDHFPYLPAAALVHVPFLVVADALGQTWDPRILGWMAVVAAMVVVARRPEPAWARLGAVLGVGSAFAIIYLSWGTNDPFAAALAVLALVLADRAPRWGGVALAVAVSAKLLLAVLVPPLALVVWLTGGAAALRRWWTFPAVLAATVTPALVADPGAFLDDTVWFNLGRSEPRMPTSGIGIPAVAPGFDGVPLVLLAGLGLVAAVVLPLVAVRRRPSVWVAGAASGLALLAVLVPARTFQVNYLVLVAALLPLVLLASTGPGRFVVPAGFTSADDLRADALFHLVTGAEWARHQAGGSIAPDSLASEGFVHCSWGRQVAGTVARHFGGVSDLLVLELDPGALGGADLVEEDTTGSGVAFPHVHGPVPLAAVRRVVRLR